MNLSLITELEKIRWQYKLCREFIRTQPHIRTLPPSCKAAGHAAFRKMEQQIEALEALIEESKGAGSWN